MSTPENPPAVSSTEETTDLQGHPDEKAMRELAVPWFKTMDELNSFIKSLIDRPHDYGTSAYAMSLAATAAFQHVAHVLGTTGFQASCADLDFIRRSRLIKGPFMILKAEDAMYPQYDLYKRLDELLADARPWMKEQAAERLAKHPDAHPGVLAHWEKLAAFEPEPATGKEAP